MTMIHTIKSWPEYFAPAYNDFKTFEIRKNDRDYQPGDIVFVREFNPETEFYTGATFKKVVLYVSVDIEKFGLMPGFAVLGVSEAYDKTLPVVYAQSL